MRAQILRATSGPESVALTRHTTAVLVLAHWRRGSHLWGLSRLVLGALRGPREPGLLWRKILGSGYQGGFGLRPGFDRLGQLALFTDIDTALNWQRHSRELDAWRSRAHECALLTLQAFSSRGQWSGREIPVVTHPPEGGPIAALTRASIRAARAARFWAHAPAAETALSQAEGCSLAIGLGEAPLLRQATFSVWRDTAAMDAYARSGAHLQAIRHAHAQDFFSESMFVRFRVLASEGSWRGHPLG